LALGADVDARSAAGHTPLLVAVFSDQTPEMVEILLAGGADPSATARCDLGCSVEGLLTVAEWAVELDRVELSELLRG
jgi:ankyrin repeat protein